VTVSKEDPVLSGSSFEMQTASAPQDEVDGNKKAVLPEGNTAFLRSDEI
jgi:hypothetical protein